ncbi:MAG: ATP-binding protein [Cyanomargarita calcarea GSE-NOS-MK-12-04C]|jgi:GTPase SAR1 family protein|uniref:ATP-binding protein n=1 Tax=Cyanomargarita calcarea GSE-NOS-MK-12-04C TaxID=2839659 RepID=A0A951UWD0_9CYAN|nr:ATP-binding protein [Cyanomargarita calcarea GSE-NOS-MK-12-04C]
MVSINEIIIREVNPFDLVNIRVGNFWTDSQDYTSIVESIHQEVIDEIEGFLNLVAMDNRSRTVLLIGDGGSGKSYLLGRLKQTFNPKAFFAYISPWVDNDYIWRHILRYTVDSLIQVPEGQQQSQLILWLKSLSAFTKLNDTIWQILLSDRQKFIKHLKNTYKLAGIYNADIFFGVLHDLTDPELYPLACEWLLGDDLSEESMQILKVKSCIDTEDAAKNILANFGKISIETQPIVLCFDQVETTPSFDTNPQYIFHINAAIHNDNLKNFLIIITIVKDNLMRAKKLIPQTDKARIEKQINLRPINLNQAEAIWAYRLQSLHHQASPQPNTSIFPLERRLLEDTFPGGKTFPRNTIILGRQKYQEYKLSLLPPKAGETPLPVVEITKEIGNHPDAKPTVKVTIRKDRPVNNPVINQLSEEELIQAEFELIWQREIKKTQQKINKICFVAATELIQMLQLALEALQIQSVKPKLIAGKSASYSLSYQSPQGKIGVVWSEDANMTSFFNIMNASHKIVQQNLCQKLYLIRKAGVGDAKLKGYQLYSQIFKATQNIHIQPNLQSAHILATYQSLVNSAQSQDLVISGKTIQLPELQSLLCKSKVLENCTLLQDLGVVAKKPESPSKTKDLRPVKDFLLNMVKIQNFMGVPTLYSHTNSQFPDISDSDVKHLIDLLCQEKKVKIIDLKAKIQDQLICLVSQ